MENFDDEIINKRIEERKEFSLTPEEKARIEKMVKRDREIRALAKEKLPEFNSRRKADKLPFWSEEEAVEYLKGAAKEFGFIEE